MFFANNEYGTRTYIDDADAKQTYLCPVCNAPLLQKRGKIMAHHFAHKAKDNCDPWYSGKMSAWHTVHVLSDCITSYDKNKLPEMMEYYANKGCTVNKLSEVV